MQEIDQFSPGLPINSSGTSCFSDVTVVLYFLHLFILVLTAFHGLSKASEWFLQPSPD